MRSTSMCIDPCYYFVNNFIFFLFKIKFFHCVLSYKFTKRFHAIFTSMHIMFIFYAPKQRYCRHWKTWWNMFAHFCCRRIFRIICCRWIFRIIFASISLFYYTLKISIKSEWCFIRFSVLIKFWYFSVFRRDCNATRIFILTYFFMRWSLFFVLKEWKQFRKWN